MSAFLPEPGWGGAGGANSWASDSANQQVALKPALCQAPGWALGCGDRQVSGPALVEFQAARSVCLSVRTDAQKPREAGWEPPGTCPQAGPCRTRSELGCLGRQDGMRMQERGFGAGGIFCLAVPSQRPQRARPWEA